MLQNRLILDRSNHERNLSNLGKELRDWHEDQAAELTVAGARWLLELRGNARAAICGVIAIGGRVELVTGDEPVEGVHVVRNKHHQKVPHAITVGANDHIAVTKFQNIPVATDTHGTELYLGNDQALLEIRTIAQTLHQGGEFQYIPPVSLEHPARS